MSNPSPLRYPGGKNKTYKYIRQLVMINNCTTYIEPFAGGSAVALNLLLDGVVKKIIINDFDKSIYALWYSIVNHPNQLIGLINDTEITIEEWYKQKELQKNKENVPLLELGFSTLFLNRTNRSGIIKGGAIGGIKQNGNYSIDCRFPKESIINKIRAISNLSSKIEVYNLDALVFINNVIKKTRNSFTFFDPPYFKKGPSLYTNFYKNEDHKELSEIIQKELRNRKWIVTYDNAIEIKNMYHKLNYIEYYLNYTAGSSKKGIEYMFYSNNLQIDDPSLYLKLYNPLVTIS
ncbi:DNA adenine methylase [Schinkia azotoformans]|uniref:DNA adenine methylase n=1 Tax=Schinkia azotoformans TaxID=1454 RepID=UPI002DBDCA99|nr:DNA adenine methylase [Schinkia azotoformans]MEC1723079.1 DNA adenine methylase [Schinkia azotoformans]MED4414727.1 DNA adenine methylase [Schinkia azotoformans]